MAHFSWSPGIGDPTIGGWITVALYLWASISCWKTASKFSLVDRQTSQECYTWRAISVLFLALGINKQLDLQSAITEVGRMLAVTEGWYDRRGIVQLDFIIFVAIVCAIVAISLLIWARNAPVSTWLALIGTTLVLGFVLMRAASFHHMDRFIGEKLLGIRWNWILEMGGISLVLAASEWRRRRAENGRVH